MGGQALVAFATSPQSSPTFPVETGVLQAVRKRLLDLISRILKSKLQTQVAQIATAADYEQKRLMATKAMHHKVIKLLTFGLVLLTFYT